MSSGLWLSWLSESSNFWSTISCRFWPLARGIMKSIGDNSWFYHELANTEFYFLVHNLFFSIAIHKFKWNIIWLLQLNEKKISASCKGPPENLHVANYKEAMATLAVPVVRDKWSNEERENLSKGVKQQFQNTLLQRSIDLLRHDFLFY